MTVKQRNRSFPYPSWRLKITESSIPFPSNKREYSIFIIPLPTRPITHPTSEKLTCYQIKVLYQNQRKMQLFETHIITIGIKWSPHSYEATYIGSPDGGGSLQVGIHCIHLSSLVSNRIKLIHTAPLNSSGLPHGHSLLHLSLYSIFSPHPHTPYISPPIYPFTSALISILLPDATYPYIHTLFVITSLHWSRLALFPIMLIIYPFLFVYSLSLFIWWPSSQRGAWRDTLNLMTLTLRRHDERRSDRPRGALDDRAVIVMLPMIGMFPFLRNGYARHVGYVRERSPSTLLESKEGPGL